MNVAMIHSAVSEESSPGPGEGVERPLTEEVAQLCKDIEFG